VVRRTYSLLSSAARNMEIRRSHDLRAIAPMMHVMMHAGVAMAAPYFVLIIGIH
jgi:hypothetical protein